jgi:uncharacterized membrane protein HdeD (DUF308 family)
MESKLPFGKKNYILMVIGILAIAIGFVIMANDTEPHGFGFLGLTLGPVVIMAGFVLEIWAILHNPEAKK